MKNACVLVVICLFVGMLLSSCGSSKPCPAYQSVSPVTSLVELPSDNNLPG